MSNGNPKFPPVLIFTIEGRPCCIANFGFMPSRVFSVYGRYEDFIKEVSEVQQSGENFVNWLIDHDLGEYIDPEDFPNNATAFLSWEIVPTAQDIGATFDIIHKFPLVMTQHLLEQLASGWKAPIFQEAHYSREDYFRFMHEKCVSAEGVESLRLTIARSVFKTKEDNWIATEGYTTQNVFDNETGINYTYSVGLTDKAGFEVIAIAAIDNNILQGLVCKVAASYTTEHPNIVPGIYTGWMKNQNGDEMRFELVEVVAGQVLGKFVNNTRGVVKRVMQLLIADKNNILPLESGYDTEGFKQPVFQQLRRIQAPGSGVSL